MAKKSGSGAAAPAASASPITPSAAAVPSQIPSPSDGGPASAGPATPYDLDAT
jgi:hypothetical protein